MEDVNGMRAIEPAGSLGFVPPGTARLMRIIGNLWPED